MQFTRTYKLSCQCVRPQRPDTAETKDPSTEPLDPRRVKHMLFTCITTKKNMIPLKGVFEALGALEGPKGPLRPTGPLVAQKALGGPQGLC